MRREDLTPEMRERAYACKSAEELMELAHEEGIDLTDDDIEGLAGGERQNRTKEKGSYHNSLK